MIETKTYLLEQSPLTEASPHILAYCLEDLTPKKVIRAYAVSTTGNPPRLFIDQLKSRGWIYDER